MNTLLQTNIDDVRAEIMRLEDAEVFDQKAWAKVLLRLAGHDTRRADAARRMETAKANQASACTDLALYVHSEEEALDGVIIEHQGVSVETDLNINLNPRAFALRPVRVVEKNNEFRFYTAITFPRAPWNGCELYLRRCKAFGYLKEDRADLVIDVLDKNGDIIQDFPITRDGFEYLREKLKFVVEERIDNMKQTVEA